MFGNRRRSLIGKGQNLVFNVMPILIVALSNFSCDISFSESIDHIPRAFIVLKNSATSHV